MEDRKKYLLEKAEEWINLTINYHEQDEELQALALKTLLEEYKQDKKVIDKMADFIFEEVDLDVPICNKKTLIDCYADIYNENVCKQCIINYFRRKCDE